MYYVPICVPEGSWAFLINTFQFTGWLTARDECWEMFGDVIMESFRDYRAREKPWALEQRKDLK